MIGSCLVLLLYLYPKGETGQRKKQLIVICYIELSLQMNKCVLEDSVLVLVVTGLERVLVVTFLVWLTTNK